MICSAKISLADAQKAIATNWVAAYKKYVTSTDKSDSSDN
jgi:hypothetical protein